MTPSFELIKELFDLPGASTASAVGSTRDKIGRDEAHSSQLGKTAVNEGDYEAAIEHFKRAVEQSNERSPWALMELGDTYALTGDVPQAFRQYEKAKLIQKSGELMIAVSALYQQVGRGSDAIKVLKQAVELEPESAFSNYKLAEGLRKEGYKFEAITAAQVAIACAPDQAFYHYWLGEYFLELRKFSEAVGALHAAIELSPGDDHFYYLASQALWGTGKRPEAIRAIRLASDIATNNVSYRGLLEKYLRASGQTEEADLEIKKISTMDLYDSDLINRVCSRLNLA